MRSAWVRGSRAILSPKPLISGWVKVMLMIESAAQPPPVRMSRNQLLKKLATREPPASVFMLALRSSWKSRKILSSPLLTPSSLTLALGLLAKRRANSCCWPVSASPERYSSSFCLWNSRLSSAATSRAWMRLRVTGSLEVSSRRRRESTGRSMWKTLE